MLGPTRRIQGCVAAVKREELTRLRSLQPLLSESLRTEGLKGRTRTIPRLLQETDSDQVLSGIYAVDAPEPETGVIGSGASVKRNLSVS